MSRFQICLCMPSHALIQKLVVLFSLILVYLIYSISPYLSQYDSQVIEIKTVSNSCDIFTTHTSHRYFKLELISTMSALTSYLQDSSISSEASSTPC